jgi:hypothetical protein
MIIQLFLSLGLVLILMYGVSQRRVSRLSHGMALLSAVGLYFVWFPAHTTALANLVGVGRGADLLLYCYIVLSLLLITTLHLRQRRQLELITELARYLALFSDTALMDQIESGRRSRKDAGVDHLGSAEDLSNDNAHR